MKIKRALFVPGFSSFYFDDQKAIKNGAGQDGFIYTGEPVTSGFRSIRQAGECVSVVLELENGLVAFGDCAAVQYSGAGGRDPLFLASQFVPFLEKNIKPLLEGRDVSEFLPNARYFDTLSIDGQRLHTAIRYGLSQALLDATAQATLRLKAEVICAEYNLPVIAEPIPLFGQSGDDRYTAVDKMILKGVDALPHGLINNVATKLGHKGEKLQDYVRWLVQRVSALRPDGSYRPSLHIDVYGTIGLIFDQDAERVAEYIAGLQDCAGPLELYIEGPVDMGEKQAQIDSMVQITNHCRAWARRSSWLPTNGVTRTKTSLTSPMPNRATWFRSRPRTWAASITSLTRCCIATPTVWKLIRAVPATKPTPARVPAFTWRLPRVRCAC